MPKNMPAETRNVVLCRGRDCTKGPECAAVVAGIALDHVVQHSKLLNHAFFSLDCGPGCCPRAFHACFATGNCRFDVSSIRRKHCRYAQPHRHRDAQSDHDYNAQRYPETGRGSDRAVFLRP
jgi:hypothetical protein